MRTQSHLGFVLLDTDASFVTQWVDLFDIGFRWPRHISCLPLTLLRSYLICRTDAIAAVAMPVSATPLVCWTWADSSLSEMLFQHYSYLKSWRGRDRGDLAVVELYLLNSFLLAYSCGASACVWVGQPDWSHHETSISRQQWPSSGATSSGQRQSVDANGLS